MNRDQAIDKIKKCLRLGKSTNEHEAAAALRQAQKLMAQYQIEAEDVISHDVTAQRARSGTYKSPAQWESHLAAIVSDAFACDLIYSPARRIDHYNWKYSDGPRPFGEWIFIGCGPAAELAQYAFVVLVRQARRARTEHIAKHLKRCGPRSRTRRADLFCDGWTAAVAHKVQRLARPETDSRAIAVYRAREVGATVDLKPRDRSAERKLSLREHADYLQGAEKGQHANLFRPMGEQRREALGS